MQKSNIETDYCLAKNVDGHWQCVSKDAINTENNFFTYYLKNDGEYSVIYQPTE